MKAALLSSKEYSITLTRSSAWLATKGMQGVPGVEAVCMGSETVGGVVGNGIGIFFGVLFSRSSMEISFEGDAVGVLLGGIVLCNVLFGVLSCPSWIFEILSDTTAGEMGERGFRITDDSISRAFVSLVKCFFTGLKAIPNFVLPA